MLYLSDLTLLKLKTSLIRAELDLDVKSRPWNHTVVNKQICGIQIQFHVNKWGSESTFFHQDVKIYQCYENVKFVHFFILEFFVAKSGPKSPKIAWI